MDMRGFGNSSWSPARDYKLETLSADVDRLLDALGWQQGGADGPFVRRARLPRDRGLAARARRGAHLRRFRARSSRRRAGGMSPSGSAGSPTCSPRSTRRWPITAITTLPPARRCAPATRRSSRRPTAATCCDAILRSATISRSALETGQSAPVPAFLWPMLSELQVPILVIRASESDMFAAETLDKARKANPRVTAIELAGSHDLAGDNPERAGRAVRRLPRQQ